MVEWGPITARIKAWDRQKYIWKLQKYYKTIRKDPKEKNLTVVDWDTDESINALFKSLTDPRLRLMGCMMGRKSRCMPEWKD